jgi:dethiobiotin synthetase
MGPRGWPQLINFLSLAKTLFITGTGTDVGKSALALAVLLWAKSRDLGCAYYKPVQCGDFPFGAPPSPHGDAEWIRALHPGPLSIHVTYRFPWPISPHLAAEKAGTVVAADRIRGDLETFARGIDLLVVEGAGGAAVPLDRGGTSLAALAAEAKLPSLVAAAPGLGTLHHTLATVAYLRSLAAPLAGFAFCHRDAEVPEIAADNAVTLQSLARMSFFGPVRHLAALAGPGPLSAAEAESLCQPLSPALDGWWSGAPR